MKKSNTSPWLSFAEEDLKLAEISLPENIFNAVCFHSQQCVEKCLKAILESKTKRVPKIHHLKELFTEVKKSEPEIENFRSEINILDRYYILTRYPAALPGSLPEGLPDQEDAQEALEIAKEIYQFTLKILS